MRILQTACTVHLCFVFTLCFVCRNKLSEFGFFHWMFCPSISGVPAPCWLSMQRTAGWDKPSRKTVTDLLFTTSSVFVD